MAEDDELWQFLRVIEDLHMRPEGWHEDSPLAKRLRRLQERYDPAFEVQSEEVAQ